MTDSESPNRLCGCVRLQVVLSLVVLWCCRDPRTWVERTLAGEELASIAPLMASPLLRSRHAVPSGFRRFDNRLWRGLNLAVRTRLNGASFD